MLLSLHFALCYTCLLFSHTVTIEPLAIDTVVRCSVTWQLIASTQILCPLCCSCKDVRLSLYLTLTYATVMWTRVRYKTQINSSLLRKKKNMTLTRDSSWLISNIWALYMSQEWKVKAVLVPLLILFLENTISRSAIRPRLDSIIHLI
jgi:hypothetical protein